MRSFTRTLNGEGIANPTGRLWSKNGVHIILRNEAYTGTLVWGVDAKDKADPVRVEKAFPAIVSKARFRRVNRKLRSRAPRRSHPRRPFGRPAAPSKAVRVSVGLGCLLGASYEPYHFLKRECLWTHGV